ncbi:MAG: hypothetical protein H3C35_02920 [Bacteroidetes bacterium]|nr:hypothetical protein [Bacteroidota bacterium]
MKTNLFLSFVFICAVSAAAQIKIIHKEKISVPSSEQWFQAQYSPSGKDIYLTNSGYNGIWKYSGKNKTLTKITEDPGSGYNFVVSQNEQQIAYRRTFQEPNSLQRSQEVVIKNLSDKSERIVASGEDIQTPVFVADNVSVTNLRTKKTILPSVKTSQPVVLGIEDQKISLLKKGKKEIFDPLKNGRYIWPVLSPDGSQLAAVDMDRGAFIADVNGTNVRRLARCNAPSWTRSGKYVIGMNDIDDGHVIIGSDIIAVSADGKQRINLTETENGLELYPHCSPTENKIVVTTSDGEVYVLTYEEE